MSRVLVATVAAVAGATVVGPFVSHAVLRWYGWRVVLPCLGPVPARTDIGRPRARCAACGRVSGPWALPAVPWLAVAGRCRGCGARYARWYLAIELVTGVGFAAAAAAVGWSVALVPALVLVTGLVAACAVDLAVMRLPTRFVHLTAVGLAAGLILVAGVDGPGRRLVGAAVGGAVYGGVLLVLHLASPRSLGFGDVRLAGVIGLAVGFGAWTSDHPVLAPVRGVFHAAFLAGLLGSAVGLVLLVVRGRDHPFPFGPALAVGGLAVALAGL